VGSTIALGLEGSISAGIEAEVTRVAGMYGYALDSGVDAAEEDARSGLAELMERLALRVVLLLRAPANASAPLAQGVDDELRRWEETGPTTAFAEFLRQVAQVAEARSLKLVVCFAAEWYEGDWVRLHEGSLSDLLAMLTRAGTWAEYLYVPKTGHWQEVDERPLVFRVRRPE
jgi:hypothetical protein